MCLVSYFLKKIKKLDTVFHQLPIFTNFREIIQKVALLIKAAEVYIELRKINFPDSMTLFYNSMLTIISYFTLINTFVFQ